MRFLLTLLSLTLAAIVALYLVVSHLPSTPVSAPAPSPALPVSSATLSPQCVQVENTLQAATSSPFATLSPSEKATVLSEESQGTTACGTSWDAFYSSTLAPWHQGQDSAASACKTMISSYSTYLPAHPAASLSQGDYDALVKNLTGSTGCPASLWDPFNSQVLLPWEAGRPHPDPTPARATPAPVRTTPAPARTTAPARPSTLVTLAGNGNKASATFSLPASGATLSYSFDCTHFYGGKGNFMVMLEDSSGAALDVPVNELAPTGAGQSNVYAPAGPYHLTIASECTWHLSLF